MGKIKQKFKDLNYWKVIAWVFIGLAFVSEYGQSHSIFLSLWAGADFWILITVGYYVHQFECEKTFNE